MVFPPYTPSYPRQRLDFSKMAALDSIHTACFKIILDLSTPKYTYIPLTISVENVKIGGEFSASAFLKRLVICLLPQIAFFKHRGITTRRNITLTLNPCTTLFKSPHHRHAGHMRLQHAGYRHRYQGLLLPRETQSILKFLDRPINFIRSKVRAR